MNNNQFPFLPRDWWQSGGYFNYSSLVNHSTPEFMPHEFKPTYGLISSPKDIVAPQIIVSPQAMADMFILTDEMQTEIGCLGSVIRNNHLFTIQEIFLVKQMVDHGTSELDPAGQAELVNELLDARPDGLDIVNNIRFWYHSHHMMGTFASQQDEGQMISFAEDVDDFFIRVIVDKYGHMYFTIFLMEENLRVDDVQWSCPQMLAITSERRQFWQEEIRKKVRMIHDIEPGIEFAGLTQYRAEQMKGVFPQILKRQRRFGLVKPGNKTGGTHDRRFVNNNHNIFYDGEFNGEGELNE